MNEATLRIGEVARLVGVNTHVRPGRPYGGAEPRPPAAMKSSQRLDDRGLENLVVTQRHQLRAVILSAAQLSIEHRRAAPPADRESHDFAG